MRHLEEVKGHGLRDYARAVPVRLYPLLVLDVHCDTVGEGRQYGRCGGVSTLSASLVPRDRFWWKTTVVAAARNGNPVDTRRASFCVQYFDFMFTSVLTQNGVAVATPRQPLHCTQRNL